jgi:hypothetical protein
MLTRLRSRWLAGGSAMLLILTLSGVVAAAALVSVVTAPPSPAVDLPVAADTTATFEDADGDGIDDDCDQEVVPDATAAAAAEKAADLDGDGVISTSEAAQSDRVGGKNCNHGGYVSTVAHDGTDTCEADGTETGDETEADEVTADEAAVAPTPADACAEATPAVEPVVETEDPAEDAETPAECVTAPAPVATPADAPPADTAPNAHGKDVSAVAQDKTAIGGKNCNHGGAVSEAAKKDQAAKDAKKNAAKEAAAAKHAAKGAKTHGKKNGD